MKLKIRKERAESLKELEKERKLFNEENSSEEEAEFDDDETDDEDEENKGEGKPTKKVKNGVEVDGESKYTFLSYKQLRIFVKYFRNRFYAQTKSSKKKKQEKKWYFNIIACLKENEQN